MATASANPVARRWQLAAQLRKLREDAGASVEDVAAELMCSVAKVSRMENAGRGIQPRDVRDLCRFYKVRKAVQDELVQFAMEAQRPGWWHDLRTLDEQVVTYIGLETAAQTLRGADALRLPGLLQTQEFSAALLDRIRPPSEKTKRWLAEALDARKKRQERVQNAEIHLHAVMDEAALRRWVGGREVMAGQVKRLLADAALPNVTLQLIPFEYGPHPGLEGSFNILGFPHGQLGEIVFVEGMVGNFIIDKVAVVHRYRMIFDQLADSCALSAPQTIEWLENLVRELTQDGSRGRRSKAPSG